MKIWKSLASISAVSALFIGGFAMPASAATKQPRCTAASINAEFTDSSGNVLTCTSQEIVNYVTKMVTVKEYVTKTKMVKKSKKETYFVTVSGKNVAKSRTIYYQEPVSYTEVIARKVPTQFPQIKINYAWTVTKPFIPSVPQLTDSNNVNLPGAPTGLTLGGRGASSASGVDSFGGCFAVTTPANIGTGILSYQVGYSNNGGKTWNFVPAIPTSNTVEPGICELEFSVTDKLTPAIVIAVRAVSKDGPGPLSEVVYFLGKSY